MHKIAARITNCSLSAEPEVPELTPHYGQSPSLRYTVSTAAYTGQFQCTVGGPVPRGSGFAQHISVKSLVRVLRGRCRSEQAQETPIGNPEVAQPPSVLRRPGVSFASSARPNLWGWDPEDGEEDDRDCFWLLQQ